MATNKSYIPVQMNVFQLIISKHFLTAIEKGNGKCLKFIHEQKNIGPGKKGKLSLPFYATARSYGPSNTHLFTGYTGPLDPQHDLTTQIDWVANKNHSLL